MRDQPTYPGRSLRAACETLAMSVLDRVSAVGPPIDIDLVADAVGLHYVPIDFDQTLGMYTRLPAGYRLRGFSGGSRGQAVALIGTHQHPLRQRFTKAHELGHHLIDHPSGWVGRIPPPLRVRYKNPKSDYHYAHEFFAASLLMPRPWIDALGPTAWRRRDVEGLARRFAVTRIAAAARLFEIYGRPTDDIGADINPRELYRLA
ncbi:MAG: ImmA/IrrE family metallo-endopeptidase [Chloroflexota bacterium]